MTGNQTVAIVDFGSQYSQLIARRVRENHVFSILVTPDVRPEELHRRNVAGVILSGGPASVYEAGAPTCHPGLFDLGVPVLGICYGMQKGVQLLGGNVGRGRSGEYGRTRLRVVEPDLLLRHVPAASVVWMSHGDAVDNIGGDFQTLATTDGCPYAAVRHRERRFYGLQFHPEVTHTAAGGQILRNFLYEICGCAGDWQAANFIEQTVAHWRDRVGDDGKVICGLSGGVDSSVTAALLRRAIGDRLACIFVDNGVLRKGEAQLVEATFRGHFNVHLVAVDAGELFLGKLAGVTDPQEKRRIIGHTFIDVFKTEADKIRNVRWLAQGTLYPDVIESGHSVGGKASSIKLHHNVGGLPAELGFELIEPLRDLFKDEVRQVGELLGLPPEIVWRHPFPGPGLAVRIVGEVTAPRVAMLQEADAIMLDEIRSAGWYDRIDQAAVVLLPVSAVGVMGDGRSYRGQQVAAVRFVQTTDFMTADWVHADPELLGRISSRIINEVPGINRVVYDISSKPPATIEWE